MGVYTLDSSKIGTKIYYTDEQYTTRIDKNNKIKTLTLTAFPDIEIMPEYNISSIKVYKDPNNNKIYIGTSQYYYCVNDHHIVSFSSTKNLIEQSPSSTSSNFSTFSGALTQNKFIRSQDEYTLDFYSFEKGNVYFNNNRLFLPAAVNGTAPTNAFTNIKLYCIEDISFALLQWYASGYNATPYSVYYLGFGYNYTINEI